MQKMDNVNLVNFTELTLKGKRSFEVAYDIAMETNLKAYAKKYVVIQPGDWPCQFYCRQIVNEHTYNQQKKKTLGKNAKPVSEKPVHRINIPPGHEYMANINQTKIASVICHHAIQPKNMLGLHCKVVGTPFTSCA